MKVDGLPTTGCNVLTGDNHVRNYLNGNYRDYYIINNRAVLASNGTYYNMPTGYVCINNDNIEYKPEVDVYFSIISIIGFILLFLSAIKLMKMWSFTRV